MVIGVTGGTGAGKTIFSNELAKMGCYVIDADRVGREIINKNKKVRDDLIKSFGPEIFDGNGNLRRRMLANIVFSSKEKLRILDSIFEKPLKERIIEMISNIKRSEKYNIILIDMATLFETGLSSLCNMIVLIDAPVNKRCKWLSESRGWTPEEAKMRIGSQMSIKLKRERADVIIENSGTVEELRNKARKFYLKIKVV